MKKFILLLAVLVLSISLVGCNSPTDTNLEDKVLALESRIDVLEARLDGIVSTTGLNGQVDYYENGIQDYDITMSVSYMEMAKTETDYLDKTKFPDYIFDETGEYIDIQQLVNRLCQKYLEMNCNSTVGFQFKIQAYKDSDMSYNDYMVRLSMMVVELSYYDFYTIDSPQLYIEFIPGGSEYMTVRMSLLVDDKYTLHPAIFWNGLMDTHLQNKSFVDISLQTIYESYIAEGTYDGFVLPEYK